jgi:L-alanine-DL-glutamate epimerase-like enolase superfamily enzyme
VSKRPIGVKFVAEDPFATDDVDAMWWWNKGPGAVGEQCITFITWHHEGSRRAMTQL